MKNLIKSALTLSISSALLAQTAFAATYEVIDLGLVDTVKHTYGIEKNPNGQAIVSGQSGYNFPVQFQYLDEEDFDDIVRYADNYHEQVFELTDIQDEDALRAGTPVPNDLQWTINWLKIQNSTRYQKISDSFVFLSDGATSTQLQIFDQMIPGTSDFSRSTAEIPKGITDAGWSFGTSSAPFLPLPPHTDDHDDVYVHWVPHDSTGSTDNAFSSRGWLKLANEETIEVTPLESSYGGLSAVNDVNINNVAVGTSSVGLNQQTLEDMLDDDDRGCNDPDYVGEGENVPYEVCIFSYKSRLFFSNAVQWNVDVANGTVIATDLGTGIDTDTLHPDDDRPFTSSANAINDNNIIVGHSHFWWDHDDTPSEHERVGSFAAVFKDGQVIDFTDRDDYFESKANDIANTGLFTGYMYGYVNGKPRTKFFYANANDDVIEPIFPVDFFKGSASVGFAINNTGFIVGEGEVETFNDTGSTPRRRHGFLYDTNTDTFSDINSFLTCDTPYTVVEARDINENNEILATAFIKQTKLNSVGEPIVIDGETITEDVLRAVYLRPIEGEVDDCSKVEEKTERKGASLGILSFLSLIPLMLFIRRKSI